MTYIQQLAWTAQQGAYGVNGGTLGFYNGTVNYVTDKDFVVRGSGMFGYRYYLFDYRFGNVHGLAIADANFNGTLVTVPPTATSLFEALANTSKTNATPLEGNGLVVVDYSADEVYGYTPGTNGMPNSYQVLARAELPIVSDTPFTGMPA